MASSSPTRRLMSSLPEDDDEDELLMGGSTKTTEKRAGFAGSGVSAQAKAPAPNPVPQKKSKPNKQGLIEQKKKSAPSNPGTSALDKSPRTPQAQIDKKDASQVIGYQSFFVAIPFQAPPDPTSLTTVDDTSPSPVSIHFQASQASSAPLATEPQEPQQQYETHESPIKVPVTDPEPTTLTFEQPPSPSIFLPSSTPPPSPPPSLPLPPAAQTQPHPSLAASEPVNETATGEPQEQEQEKPVPVEQFFRNEIDPSYEFSDEDELPSRNTLELPVSQPNDAVLSAPVKAVLPANTLEDAVLPVSVGAEEVPEPLPPVKKKRRRPGRPKGWRKSKPEAVKPPAVKAAVPSSPPCPPAEETSALHDEPVVVYSRDEENPPVNEDAHAEDVDRVPELPDIYIAPLPEDSPMIDLPNDETQTQEAVLPDLPDNPETAVQDIALPDLPKEPVNETAPNKPLINIALAAPTAADAPSPVRSDDSLGLALDAIIASQRLFEDSDRNFESSPVKPVDESPTRHVLAHRTSARKRRRSVHFLEEELRDDRIRPKIISTPPLRRGSAQPEQTQGTAPEEAPQETAKAPPQNRAAPSPLSGVVDLTTLPDEDPQPPARSMLSGQKARRKQGGSRTSSPAHKTITALKAKQPPVKRRSLLSIALDDSDDDDPLNAMCLLTTWTRSAPGTPRGSPARSPAGSRRRTGSDSTIRKRLAREGFGGLSTPTKRTGSLAAGSPTGSVIYTPGGHARRCGVDGFRCDRDFCFTCL